MGREDRQAVVDRELPRGAVKKGLIALVCAALVCAAAAAVLFRDVLFLPGWVQWQQRQIVCEGEAAPDRFELRERRALARASDKVLWR